MRNDDLKVIARTRGLGGWQRSLNWTDDPDSNYEEGFDRGWAECFKHAEEFYNDFVLGSICKEDLELFISKWKKHFEDDRKGIHSQGEKTPDQLNKSGGKK